MSSLANNVLLCLTAIGITFYLVGQNWALISAFVVDEDCRGEGIGAALLNAAEQHAFAPGCGQIELSGNERRIRSHAFYEHNGYEEKRKRFVKYAG